MCTHRCVSVSPHFHFMAFSRDSWPTQTKIAIIFSGGRESFSQNVWADFPKPYFAMKNCKMLDRWKTEDSTFYFLFHFHYIEATNTSNFIHSTWQVTDHH